MYQVGRAKKFRVSARPVRMHVKIFGLLLVHSSARHPQVPQQSAIQKREKNFPRRHLTVGTVGLGSTFSYRPITAEVYFECHICVKFIN